MLTISEKITAIPVLWPLITFIAGILLHDITGFRFTGQSLQIVLCSIIMVYIFLLFFLPGKYEKLTSLILITGFLIGGLLCAKVNSKNITQQAGDIFIAEVVSPPSRKPASIHFRMRLLSDANDKSFISDNIYINAYFSLQNHDSLPRPGDVLLLKTRLNKVTNAGNPGEFDYARYLRIRNIFFSCFISEGCWKKTDFPPSMGRLKLGALRMKEYLQEKIKKIAGENPGSDYEVMLAICTGDKSELDPEVKTAFSNAGAIHIMAVSGLHVGMIWVFLNYLTFFLGKRKSGKIMRFLIITGVLWFYAMMTGLSASVIRSVTMFSLASFAVLINRRSYIFNTIFISAFIQILLNKNIIYDVGFQFSYTAVLSILLFQPPLNTIYKSKFKIIRKNLDLVTVSLSAQILTFPLAAVYFHQFPVYFLLTNICVIPMVTLLMIFFLSSALFFFIPPVSDFLLLLSLKLSSLMNLCVGMINELPGKIITNIHLTTSQVIIFFLTALILLLFYYYRKYFYLLLAEAMIALIILTGTIEYKMHNKQELCVFNVKKTSAISIRYKQLNLLLFNDQSDIQNIRYASSGYLIKNYNGKQENIPFKEMENRITDYYFPLPGKNNFILYTDNQKITVINDYTIFSEFNSSASIYTEIIILGCVPLPDYGELQKFFTFKKIVVTPAVSFYLPDIRVPDSLSIEYHRVEEMGAFICELL